MKIPQSRFRVPQFYGDDNWHIANVHNYQLSISNPKAVIIGVSTELPTEGIKLKSNYLWRYSFNSASSTNWYSSSAGSNGNTAITALNVGITSTSTDYKIAHGEVVESGYITTGSQGLTKTQLSTIRFYTYNNWYFTPSVSVPSNSANRAIVIKFLAEYEADLPSDMYTISGNSVTWNTSHPVFTLLYGEECLVY